MIVVTRTLLFASLVAVNGLAVVPTASAAAFTRGTETAARYGVHEIALTGGGAVANPFDTIATVTFTPPSGAGQARTVEAFYDGGTVWRARVYADEIGTWTWASTSATDAGLDAKDGAFTVAAGSPTLRGKLIKHPTNPKAWATDNGEWFLNISDTGYYLFNPASTQWQQFVGDNAALGVNSIRANLVGALRQFSKQQTSDGWDRVFADATRNTLAVSAFQLQDERMEWMLNNHPGMYLQLIATPEPGQGDDQIWVNLTSAQRTRFLRHIVARYAAWPQIFWLVTNDAFVSNHPKNVAMIKEIGAYLAAHDPWADKNLRSSGQRRDTGFAFTAEPWVGYIHLETTYDLAAAQQDPHAAVPMHVYNGEDWYEEEKPIADDPYFFRRLFWAWTLSGGSATYGGAWNRILAYEGTTFTGLNDVIHLRDFFVSNNLALVDLVEDDARVTGPSGARKAKVMRTADSKRFVVYHPNAGADAYQTVPASGTAKFTVTGLAAGEYSLRWMRADDGSVQDAAPFAHAGGDLVCTAPWAGVDVVAYLRRPEPVKLIFDTDFRTDVDDPGTLAMLHGLADLGLVDIVGVVTSTSGTSVVGSIDAVNTYHGRPNIPIGLAPSTLGSGGSDPYAAIIANATTYPNDQTNSTAPEAIVLYRSLLHAAAPGSIRINVVGGQNIVHALMTSPANYKNDGIPFTGMELAAAKVAELTIMGGNFLSSAVSENNIKRGIVAAQEVAANWPTRIVYSGWEVGNKVRTGAALSNPAVNPVAKAYEVFSGSGGVGVIGDRDSWDQTSALYGVVGSDWLGARLWDLSVPHDITFDSGGLTIATPNSSATRFFQIKRMADADIATVISNLMIGAYGGSTPPDPTPDPEPVEGTIAWYRFEESPGASDPGNPILNLGDGGPTLHLVNTGGPDGRDNTGVGGYRATGREGHGYAFDVLASGDGTHHSGAGGSATGGGLMTASTVSQDLLQGPDGAFTYEAFINLTNTTTTEQTILGHDGGTVRGFLFRVVSGKLSFYTGSTALEAPIPTSGAHAFVAGNWFHVAVTYDGAAGVANNLRFYWTALDASPTHEAANLIGAATMAADLASGVSNQLGVGTTTRSPFRFELGGLVDEVGIGSHARAAGDFHFVTPPSVVSDTDGDGLPDAWETAHGLDPEVDDHAGDRDGDGIPNLLEFALDLDPNAADSADGLPTLSIEDSFLTLTALRNPDATELTFVAEISSDLINWQTDEAHVVVLEDAPDLFRARDAFPMDESARRFLRLRVTTAP